MFEQNVTKMFSEKALKYFRNLEVVPKLPSGIEIINPYKIRFSLVKEFYKKFFSDSNSRLYILGINPGRYGGGLTGISFTDPVALRRFCAIENDLGDKRELSSEFIYMVIEELGGAEKFFSRYFLSAIFPLALIKDAKNYNFYDDKKTLNTLLPYLKISISRQAEFGARKDKVIALGLKNAGILNIINDEINLFNKIEVLEHPRFIMQYKRKHLKEYIKKYVDALR